MGNPESRLSNWPELSAAVQQVAADNTSGAAELLNNAADLFSLARQNIESDPTVSVEDSHAMIREISMILAASQPDIAPLLNLLVHVQSAIAEAGTDESAAGIAAQTAEEFVRYAHESAERAAEFFAGLISDNSTILTLSRSSTVLAGFKIANKSGRKFSVIIAESRPMLEGRSVAIELANAGIPVTLIADAAAGLMVEKATLIAVGADRVTPTHVLNKIGTYTIALAAREKRTPIYVIADSSKYMQAAEDAGNIQPSRPAVELWQAAAPGVTVLNRYFEPVPIDLLTGVVTEEGVLDPKEASGRVASMLRSLGYGE